MKMKVLGFLLLILLITGCGINGEEVVCTLDQNYGTYSGLHIIYLSSKDQNYVSSIYLKDRYLASFEDTDFSFLREELKNRQTKYLNDYERATSEYSEREGLLILSTNLPLTSHNLELLELETIVKNDRITLQEYQTYLENKGYRCE